MTLEPESNSPFAELQPVVNPTVAIRSHRRLPKWLVPGTIGMAVLLAGGVAWVESWDRVPDDAPRVTIWVDGMHCPITCGIRVTQALERIPGVIPRSGEANPRTGRVVIAMEPGSTADRLAFQRAILQAGFVMRDLESSQMEPETAGD